jgi:hypothetical protein
MAQDFPFRSGSIGSPGPSIDAPEVLHPSCPFRQIRRGPCSKTLENQPAIAARSMPVRERTLRLSQSLTDLDGTK